MRPPRSAVPVALVGAVVWFGLFLTARKPAGPLGAIELLLALAPLVVVPLGLGLVQPSGDESPPLALTLARRLQPMAASFAVASLVLPLGSKPSLGSAIAWLVVPVLCALAGASRFVSRRGTHPAGELAIDAALLYLPVGGAWWVSARAGWRFLGFDDTFSLLTAAHFHYAAFSAPLLTGLAQRALRAHPKASQQPAARALSRVALCVVAGMGLTAAGITATRFGAPRVIEFVSAAFTSLSMTALAALGLFAVVPAVAHRGARVALGLSYGSLFASMFLSMTYAYGMFRGRAILDIPRMAQLHGTINALGFALCGLVAWTLTQPPAPAPAPESEGKREPESASSESEPAS